MDKQTQQAVYELLGTMGEALDHLHLTEQEELRQLVFDGRRQVTGVLENALGQTLDQRVSASKLSDEDWLRTAYFIVGELTGPFRPKNFIDREFLNLLNDLWSHSEQELLERMKHSLAELKNFSEEDYRGFVDYFAKFPLWGTLAPDREDYNTLELRVAVLKRHSYDFLWLYCRMEDYLSRRTLCAILRNWAVLDTGELLAVKSIFPDYWEPDIFPDNEGDILVDVGAYTGDSIYQYVSTYGTGYRKIYAYEISPDSCELLCRNISVLNFHDVVLRQKGVGADRGEMYLSSSESVNPANHLSRQGSTRIEVVRLDEDLEDEVTFLKMDIEGAEQSALLGSERLIRSRHPKLAICVYHGYEDIWKIPLMIDGMYPEYRFYLRHYGGNLNPTEFVLLCKP